jgi:hypothetical protein
MSYASPPAPMPPHAMPPMPPAATPPVPVAPVRSLGLLDRIIRDPNPIWMREMRQAARLGRTPWVLFAVTLMISLLMCSIGGVAAASSTPPAGIGEALFQVFFSLAYLVVVLVGPTVAANGIASEREGKTWEAVLLTGLTAKEIARGKFLAAYTTMALYLVVLSPVGALSFLFGGVTATEVVIAFVFLFLFAALAVAFGLAVSSFMTSLRGAIVVTLMLAICLGPMLYLFFGLSASFGMHSLWQDVPEAYPVWLPLAFERAPFGLEYLTFLVVLPILLIAMPAWFLYEVTVSNLGSDGDDRSTGLKRWFVVCTPLFAAGCAAPSLGVLDNDTRMGLGVLGMACFFVHLTFAAFLFASEPYGPSRRVRVHWARAGVGIVRRFFGPGLMKTALLALLFGVAGLAAIASLDVLGVVVVGTGRSVRVPVMQIGAFAGYAIPFFVFMMGLVAWLRARGMSPWIVRLVAGAALFLIFSGPWVVAAIGGVITQTGSDAWLVVASPSPFYVVYVITWLDRFPSGGSDGSVLEAGIVCATLWGGLGLLLLGLAARRASRAIREMDAAVAQAEMALVAADQQAAATHSPAPAQVPGT